MHISKINLRCFRNYYDTEINLSEGLNVLVGPNNVGKSNLIRAISMLSSIPNIDINDFNKHDLLKNYNKYKTNPPIISIIYTIEHSFSYDIEDSALSKLKPILIYDKDAQLKESNDNDVFIKAMVELKCELEKPYETDYVNDMNNVKSFDEFYKILERYEEYFSWTYYNVNNNEEIKDKKDINTIFEIDEVPTYRNVEELEEKSKTYVSNKITNNKSLNEVEIQQDITKKIKKELNEISEEINEEIKADQDKIGIVDGRNNFVSDFVFDSKLSAFFRYNLRDDKDNFYLPLSSNGTGYNNLIYMRNLIKQKKDNDYNILMIEEPEAHLHPNMQYKLLQYLNTLETIKTLNSEINIRNQIIITTHSPNISASVDLNKIIVLSYDNDNDNQVPYINAVNLSDCFNLKKIKSKQLIDFTFVSNQEKKNIKEIDKDLEDLLNKAKQHLHKFLDVTRSDMLFSEKIILVEGLSEKMAMPYIDKNLINNHVCIVEVGGINFNYFLPLTFFTNKKILCITDKDKEVYNENKKELIDLKDYKSKEVGISYIFKYINTNIKIATQIKFGSTFEKELFLENYPYKTKRKKMLSLALPQCCKELLKNTALLHWYNNLDSITNIKTREFVKEKIDLYYSNYINNNAKNKKLIEKMFFTNLFYSYIKNSKGNFCLQILDLLSNKEIKTPEYILKGLEWINK